MCYKMNNLDWLQTYYVRTWLFNSYPNSDWPVCTSTGNTLCVCIYSNDWHIVPLELFNNTLTLNIINVNLVILRCLNNLLAIMAKLDSSVVFLALMSSMKLSNQSTICQINNPTNRVHARHNTKIAFVGQVEAINWMSNIDLKKLAFSQVVNTNSAIDWTGNDTRICHGYFCHTVFKVSKALYWSLISAHEIPQTDRAVHTCTGAHWCFFVNAHWVYLGSMALKFPDVLTFKSFP